MTQFKLKLADYEKIKERIKERIKVSQEHLRLVKIVFDVCEKFEGKQITKRIATAMQKEVSDYTVSYDTTAGMFHLRIWSRNWKHILNYDNRFSALLGYDTNTIVNMEKVRYYNQCHTLDEKRIVGYKTTLKKLKGFVKRYNKIFQSFDELYTELEKNDSQYMFFKDIVD